MSLTVETEYKIFDGTGVPDAAVAAGDTHLVVAKNSKMAIVDKSSGFIEYDRQLHLWFFDVLVDPENDSVFDPRAVYDEYGERFILMACVKNDSDERGSYVISVSSTSDPHDDWHMYRIDLNNNEWVDFPGLAFSGQYITLTGNIYEFGNGFKSSQAVVMDKSEVYAGNSDPYYLYYVDLQAENGTDAFRPFPVNQGGDDGSTIYLIHAYHSGGNKMTIIEITDPLLIFGESTTVHTVDISDYTPPRPEGAEQPDTDDRLEMDAGFSNRGVMASDGNIWCTQSVKHDWDGDAEDETIIYWYEIDPTDMKVSKSGNFGYPDDYFWYPAIATNLGGTMIVYARSSNDLYASVDCVAIDKDTYDYHFESLKNGESAYEISDKNNVEQWGDYLAIDTDGNSAHKYAILGEYPLDPNNTTEYGLWAAIVQYI